MDVQSPAASPSARPKTKIKNYYEVLQISPSASRVLVREAFLRLKKTYGSASQAIYSLMDDEEARQALAEIEEAFRILDDDHLRKEHDMQLKSNGDLSNGGRPFHAGLDEVESWRSEDQSEAGALPNLMKRTPTLSKVSPRLQDAAVRQRVDEIWGSGDIGDGLMYKHVREAAGIDLKDLYAQTKIIPEYIAAIESNDFSKLPALVYIKGFLRSYLQFLGVANLAGAIQAFTEKWQAWEKASQH